MIARGSEITILRPEIIATELRRIGRISLGQVGKRVSDRPQLRIEKAILHDLGAPGSFVIER
jgi:hypothetical protein